MPDPLSITTGVLALLQVTWTVATELKKFQDEVSVVKESIGGLQRDVDGLTRVLESMRDTFANITAEHGTGIVAAHWSNIAKSVVDGQDILLQLQHEVQRIDKTTTFLDGARKQLRLNLAEDKISGFRIHIQAYRDALQLSLQTIILSNQMSQQKSTDLLVPNLSNLQTDVRRLAMDFNQKIDSLQAMVLSQQDQVKLTAMSNLRNCVRSSASIMSSATTVIASQRGVQPQNTTVPGSDFGDCFPMDGIALRRWMESNTVYEYDVITSNAPPHSVADIPIIGDSDPGAGSDSDSDFESDITSALLESGKSRIASGDHKAAEKLLRNCLSRATSAQSKRTRKQTAQHLEIVTLLVGLYMAQKRWAEAQEMLTLKMVANERLVGKKDVDFLDDVVLLARLAQSAGNLVGAQLHARRALKGFRRAGVTTIPQQRSCLALLVELCKDNHNTDDEEAFEVMLAMITAEHNPDISPASEIGPPYPDYSQATDAVPSAPLHYVDTSVGGGAFLGQESDPSVVSAAAEDLLRLRLATLDRPHCIPRSTSRRHSRDHDTFHAALWGEPAPPPPQLSSNNRASSEGAPPFPRSNSRGVASQPPNNDYYGGVAAKVVPQRGESSIAASDMSAISEPVMTLHPARSQSYSSQSSRNSRTFSTMLLPTSSDAGTETTAPSSALKSWTAASTHSRVWELGEEQRQRSLKYLNRIIAGPDDNPVKEWAFAATVLLVHLGRSAPVDADVHAAIKAVFAKWPTERNLTDPDFYVVARTIVTQLLQRYGSGFWKSIDGRTPSVGPDEDLLAMLSNSPPGVENLLDRTIPSWRTWSELVNPDCSLPTIVFSPPIAKNNDTHNQTFASILNDTPAESLLKPQSIDGDANSRILQANEDSASRSFGLSGEPLKKCERKAVLVGDGACGKSALLRVLTKGGFPEGYCCGDIFGNYSANIEIDDMSTKLALWDTPGQEDYDRIRPLSYHDAHVVLICFSIDNPNSLDNIHEKWLPEVSHFCAGVPIVLVGTKSDLRYDGEIIAELHKTSEHPVTYEEALEAQIKIGAKAYAECSAKLSEGVAEVFETAVRCALERKPAKAKRRRSLLRMFGMSRD